MKSVLLPNAPRALLFLGGNCDSIKLSSRIGAKICWSGEISGFQGNCQMGKVVLIPFQSRTTSLCLYCVPSWMVKLV